MKKLKFNNEPFIIKNKRFNTIDFIFLYPYPYEKKDMYDIRLLKNLLKCTSKDYPTEQEFKKQLLKKMIIGYDVRTIIINKNLYFEISLFIPNPNKVKTFNLDEAFSFFINAIYNPNITADEFNVKQFQREKKYLAASINNNMKNIYNYSYQRFINYYDNIGNLKNNIFTNQPLLEKTTPLSVFKCYQKIITNNEPLIIIFGDISNKQVNDLFEKYHPYHHQNIVINKDYYEFLSPRKEYQYIEETSHYNQSVLYLGYKVLDMQEEDREYLELLGRIIDSRSTNLLFKALRLNNNLVYQTGLNFNTNYGIIYINAYLHKNSKDKAIKIIKELIDNLNNKEQISQYIKIILEEIDKQLIRQKDSKYANVNNYINKKLQLNTNLKEKYNIYSHIAVDQFLAFLKRVKLDTIYFLRGDDEEDDERKQSI